MIKKVLYSITSWVTTIFYIPCFVAILCIFDLMFRITIRFSYAKFRKLETLMCRIIRLNLIFWTGATFKLTLPNYLPKDRSIIVISNHQSMYDVSLLTEIFHEHSPRFISKKELGKWVPAVSFLARNNKTGLIDRSNRTQALKAIEEVAKQTATDKGCLLIFPEGTRAKDGVMKPFKIVGSLSILSYLPDAIIIPVAINGTWKLLKNNFLPVPYGVRVEVEALEPIDLRYVSNDHKSLLELIEKNIYQKVKNTSQCS